MIKTITALERDGNEILCTGHVDETGMMYSG